MIITKYSLTLTITFPFLFAFASASENLIINGGFNGNADGWIITDTFGGFGFTPVLGNPGGNVLLDSFNPTLETDPTATQTVADLVPGSTYLISGDYKPGKLRGSDLPIGQSFGVAMDGEYIFTTHAPADFTWRQFSVLYVATSPTSVVTLSSQINGTGSTYAIDNIAMHVIPEPRSLVIALAGVCAIAVYSRRASRSFPTHAENVV